MVDLTFIARATDGLILVETWNESSKNESSQYKNQAKQILKKMDRAPPRGAIETTNATFYYLVEDGVCYMTLCQKNFPKKLSFAYLEDLHRAFLEELKKEFGTSSNVDYRSHIDTIEKPYYFIKFDRTIQQKKREYSDTRSSRNEAMAKLNNSLGDVKAIMSKNIEDVLTRGENLEDVGKKAQDLRTQSELFKNQAKKLNLHALLKAYGPIAVIVLVFLIFIIWRFVL
uniref:Vesicle-trafficking protein SEC22b n=1 Tax=Chromera velia CCMP2878 TaxID=1169474 RepID=A0A0G4I3T2_9ALVE|eukprot:Cvel_10754.t1-p1 / transcript=Cvel_10754.t1 / gene=Cvel_10754 / organism=Chromera_velia_CCMP2878 / gene_product=Vesicle-trafficking protein SEC22b, putative / transcript_product=Vesicle-trafficking protein SEC22b, putative / location=Cvel_scaffold656:32351-35089(+) / protein_length=227 / sequence_SO=supercontig / SO=protein_coding / is_pseudo=false